MIQAAPRHLPAAALLLLLAACGGSGPSTPTATAPGAPTAVQATPGVQSALLAWTAPASDGGSAISGYAVLVSPADPSAVSIVTGTTALVTGLASGATYTFRVTATNAVGTGPASAPSPGVTPLAPPPSLATVAPSQGPAAGGTTATLVGAGFVAPVTVTFGGAPGAVVSASPNAVTVVTPPHAPGVVAVVLTNADARSATLSGGFTFTSSPVVPPPSLSGVTPVSGPTSGSTTVAISGADFDAGAAATFGGQPAAVVSRTASTLTVNTPAGAAGPVDVVVTNGDAQSATLPAAFTYVAPPSLASVTPTSGPVAGGTVVTLAGSGFIAGPGGSTVTFGGAAATVTNRTASTLVVTTPAHPAGPQAVVVANPDGQTATLPGSFSFVDPPPGPPAPTLSGVSPSSGPTAGGAQVTLTGTNFVSGGVVTFGGVAGTVVAPVFPTQLTVTTPAQPPGTVDVTWANPLTGQVASLQGGYTFVGPPPVIDVLSLRGAPPAGGTTLNILGSGFQPGITATFGGAPGTGLVISAATPPRQYLTLTTPPQPSGAGALVDLVVRNPDGQSATFPGFHYGPAPGVAAVAVAAPGSLGNVHKGDVITITGADFGAIPGVQVQIGLFAVISSATASELVVVAPKNNPGTYQVVVTNTDGQFGVAPPAFNLVYQGP